MATAPRFRLATQADVPALTALQASTAADLTARYGPGHWSTFPSERGVASQVRGGKVYVAERRTRIIGTFRLVTKKPWAIDVSYFHPVPKPLYLLNMAVLPELQRSGIGRRCLEEAEQYARRWPADAIRLDAYDADAGAGPFYERCGYVEVGRVVYRKTPLVYFERVLNP